MAKKYINWKTKGMNRDMSVSAFNPEFAFENLNIRLATNEGNTMMSWVNERGPKKLKLRVDTKPWATEDFVGRYDSNVDEETKEITDATVIRGIPVGTAVLNHKLVLFTVNDYIYLFEKSDDKDYDLEGKVLYFGSLGFSPNYPIETLVSYESENIQKVYWTDGLNQPRIINIASAMNYKLGKYNDSSFDFVPELALKETVSVSKMYGAGEFPPGVIQYAFTYYNKHCQESNIFYTTPLQYISYINRAGSPEEKVANCFKIKVNNIDKNFDYMRIYSILRTSKDATPVVKRIQDLEIREDATSVAYIDNGTSGEIVDPTELLYKGGEEIVAKTIEQKDETLFLGNITVKRPPLSIKERLLEENGVTDTKFLANDNISSLAVDRGFKRSSKPPLTYYNTLDTDDDYKGASCFKSREYYRLGVQFQYKNGRWSEPCWIGDKQCLAVPSEETKVGTRLDPTGRQIIKVPEFKYTMKAVRKTGISSIFENLHKQGYRKVRPVFAIPRTQDRTILCQGIGCPTMYRKVDRDNNLYAVSSWLFRPENSVSGMSLDWNIPNESFPEDKGYTGGGVVTSNDRLVSQYTKQFIQDLVNINSTIISPYLSSTEVMGTYNDKDSFRVDPYFITLNSPDIEFDDFIAHTDFKGYGLSTVGYTTFDKTYGDINIQTSTPTIGSNSAGFVHRSIVAPGCGALISGLFYNDHIADDTDAEGKYGTYCPDNPPVDFPVYMWHKNGSLNNDVARDNRSAQLLKKRISNYRFGSKITYAKIQYAPILENPEYSDIQLFNSDTLSIVKVNGEVYQGNVDTMVMPSEPSPYYFVGWPWRKNVDTDYKTKCQLKISLENPNDLSSKCGIFELKKVDNSWVWSIPLQISNPIKPTITVNGNDIGDHVKNISYWREGVQIKYKSTPHLVAKISESVYSWEPFVLGGVFSTLIAGQSPIIEVYKEYDKDIIFGGASDEALQAAIWIPCGPSVLFDENTQSIDLNYKWGDTYFQRYECLKTYPFSSEDKNQVVDIASFMVETRVNIDGRYDKNRGQVSNLNVTPQNFNLINPVYSQMDNFFSYKIMDEDSYKDTVFPNTVTWTKTKQNGADVDLWTNITLANTLEMDGNKGKVNKLIRLNNQLLSFQDSGISQILYNENTQISTTEGVPIEIANSQKVQGKRYYSDTVGCSNKWSMVQTPSGIYFMDSNEKSIYLFNGQLNNLSTVGGFNAWAKQNIPSAEVEWTANMFDSFVAYYDKLNQDVLFINEEIALAYSEKFNCFTSFYDYGGTPFFVNLDDIGIWIKNLNLWQHQAGEYCNFFGENKSYSMTLVANQEPQIDKMFTNLEFRACVEGEGVYDENTGKFKPALPFDTVEAWNEYQHGMLSLSDRDGHDRFTHGNSDRNASLNRKFRMWRCDIPRDNVEVNKINAATESLMGIKRFKARPLDRIRNPWAYIKLTKNVATSKVEVHDIMVTYFG